MRSQSLLAHLLLYCMAASAQSFAELGKLYD